MKIGGGRRGSAPFAPPIPTPPPPPSAYGIDIYGPAPTPTESAPPTQYTPQQYAPPQYGGAPSQFGGAPSHFGGPPTQLGGAGAYAAPTWASAPAPTSKRRRISIIALVAVAALMALGAWVNAFDNATAHHVGALPPTLNDLTMDQDPQIQAAIATAVAKANTNDSMRGITHFQMGIYQSTAPAVVAVVGELPGSATRNRSEFLQGFASGAASSSPGLTMNPVDAGPKGGSESCGESTTGVAVCAWIDKGTIGAVVVQASTVEDAHALLNELRDATEH